MTFSLPTWCQHWRAPCPGAQPLCTFSGRSVSPADKLYSRRSRIIWTKTKFLKSKSVIPKIISIQVYTCSIGYIEWHPSERHLQVECTCYKTLEYYFRKGHIYVLLRARGRILGGMEDSNGSDNWVGPCGGVALTPNPLQPWDIFINTIPVIYLGHQYEYFQPGCCKTGTANVWWYFSHYLKDPPENDMVLKWDFKHGILNNMVF